jgi:hypothetical protein
VVLEGNGEVVLAVLDGDGVHDDLQEITASPKRWLKSSEASCIGGKGRPEVRPWHGRAEHGEVRCDAVVFGNEIHIG